MENFKSSLHTLPEIQLCRSGQSVTLVPINPWFSSQNKNYKKKKNEMPGIKKIYFLSDLLSSKPIFILETFFVLEQYLKKYMTLEKKSCHMQGSS